MNMRPFVVAFSRHIVFLMTLPLFVVAMNPCSTAWAQNHSGWVVGEPADGYATIVHTSDGGATWLRQGSPTVVPDVMLASVSAVDVRSAWAVGDKDQGFGTILHTRDGGMTWERQGAAGEIPDVQLLKVRAVDARIVWAVGFEGTVLRALDGGETWTEI